MSDYTLETKLDEIRAWLVKWPLEDLLALEVLVIEVREQAEARARSKREEADRLRARRVVGRDV
jgi:hypothetical protein